MPVLLVSRPTVYRSLERTAALPPDTRPAPDVAKYDQLLTAPTDQENRYGVVPPRDGDAVARPRQQHEQKP